MVKIRPCPNCKTTEHMFLKWEEVKHHYQRLRVRCWECNFNKLVGKTERF